MSLYAEYFILPIQSEESLWVSSISGGPLYTLPLGEKITLSTAATAGYYFFNSRGWTTEVDDKNGWCWGIQGTASYLLKDPLSIGLGVGFNYYNDLYNGINMSLLGRMNIAGPAKERALRDYSQKKGKGKGIELLEIELFAPYPVLYRYYSDHPLGTVRVRNFESREITDISIQLFVDRYMDNPTTRMENFSLNPGDEKVISLYGLLTEVIMEITEGTSVSARLTVRYTIDEKEKGREYNPVIELKNRKVASFITAKDPYILNISRKAGNWMQANRNHAVDENLQKGKMIFLKPLKATVSVMRSTRQHPIQNRPASRGR